MTRFRFFLRAAAAVLLLAPGAAVANGSAPAAEPGMRVISGSVTYLPRIALPTEAEVIVETILPDGARLETTRPSLGGQVPLPFSAQAPAGREATLRAGIRAEGALRWLGDPVRVPAGEGPVDLGELTLAAHVPMGMASVVRCGDAVLEVGFLDDIARLRAGADREAPEAPPAVDGVRDLGPEPAASGARYGAADGETWVWSRGEALMVRLDGVMLPDCVMAPAPLRLPATARGNEPFWTLSITPERIAYAPMTGPGIETATPLPQAAGAGWAYAPVGVDLAVTLRPGVCRDSMTGMPHPAAAEVETGGQVLTGCAGAPVDLLAGAWTVIEVEGAPPPDDATATLEFDAAEMRAFGNSGCNRFTGAFALTGETLSFPQPIAGTMMACPDPQMALERQVLDALAEIQGFDIAEDGTLELRAADRTAIRARR